MPEAKSITPEELKRRLDAGEIQFIFDLRAEDEFKSWKVEGKTDVPTMNIPQEDFVGEEEKFFDRFPKDKEIITICAHGDSSQYTADMLSERGFKARGLKGGMDLWSEFYEARKVSESPLVYQIYRVAKGCIGHVVTSDGQAAVLDAPRHIENVTRIIDESGAKVVAVLDTHLHADHISGGPALAKKYNAPYYIHQADTKGATYEHRVMHNHDRIKVGGSVIEVLHSPGHTPGSTSFLLDGKILFTGDTVMETSIGRPDLGGMVGSWAGFLYYTLFKRYKGLPDDILVLPAHAASIREQDEQGIVRFTLGWARQKRSLFHITEMGKFKEAIKSTLLENPERYADIRQVNLGVLEADEKKLKELEIGKNLCGMAGKKGA